MPEIKFKRGLVATIPTLDEAEPGYTTDTQEFFIGSAANGNIKLAKQTDLDATNTKVSFDSGRIDDIGTINANAEVVNARGTFPQLADRLNNSDSSISNRLNGHFINVLYPPSPLNTLKGDGTAENMTDVQAIFDSIQNTGGIIFFPGNKRYVFTSTITIHDGTTVLGAGKNPTNAYPTILDFKAITGTSSGFLINGGSDITLKDFYMYGTDTGSGSDIALAGNNRRVNIENIILNTKTTGYGICAGTGGAGYLITSFWKDIIVVGAGTGFYLSSGSTSVSLYNCYADYCTQYGYIIAGTYCSLHSCASDYNTLYGYVLQSANQVGLYSCGGESNGRGAVLALNSTGIDFMTFRAHNNNTSASTFYPSFLDIQNSNRILISNCQDSLPNASTTYSVTSTTADSGANILIVNPNFVKPISPRLLNVPRIDGSMYPGIIASANVGNNSIFIDSADNRLKTKDVNGNVNFIPLRYQSLTANATYTGSTISTQNLSLSRVAPTTSVTGVILQAGTLGGQEIIVVNESASANTITFASTGSNVADGSSDVISGGTARKFVWDTGMNLWYRIQ